MSTSFENAAHWERGLITTAYNCEGVNNGSFSFCTPGSYGSCNDKTIVRFDSYIDSLRTLNLYTKMKYSLLMNVEGEMEWMEGVYVMTGRIFLSFFLFFFPSPPPSPLFFSFFLSPHPSFFFFLSFSPSLFFSLLFFFVFFLCSFFLSHIYIFFSFFYFSLQNKSPIL